MDFVPDLLVHSLRAPATNARHFYSCFQACILPPNFLTGSLRTGKLHRCGAAAAGGEAAIMVPIPLFDVERLREGVEMTARTEVAVCSAQDDI